MSYRAIEDHAVKMIETFRSRERNQIIPMFPAVQGHASSGVNIAQPEILQEGPERVCIVRYASGKDATAIGTARNHTRFYRTDWGLMLTCYFRPAENIESDTLLIQAFNMTLGNRMRELYDELSRRPTMSYLTAGEGGFEYNEITGQLENFEIQRYTETDITESEYPTADNPWGRNSSQILGAEPMTWGDPEIFAGPMARYVKVDMEYRVREGYQLSPIL